MNHHRCSRCKEESETRHKHVSGGVLCQPCIRYMVRGRVVERRSLWGRFTDIFQRLKEWMVTNFNPERKQEAIHNERVKVHYSTQKAKATNIPRDLSQMNPQKR